MINILLTCVNTIIHKYKVLSEMEAEHLVQKLKIRIIYWFVNSLLFRHFILATARLCVSISEATSYNSPRLLLSVINSFTNQFIHEY